MAGERGVGGRGAGPRTVREVVERVRTVGETAPDIGGPPEKEEEKVESAVEQLLQELPGAAKIKVYRKEKLSDAYLGSIPVESFNEDRLMEVYGGGEYKLKVMNSKGVFVKHLQLTLGGRPKSPDEVQMTANGPIPIGRMDEGGGNVLVPFLLQRLGTMEDRVMERVLTPPPPPPPPPEHRLDVVALIAALAPIIAPVLTAIVERNAAPPPPMGVGEVLNGAAELVRAGMEAGGGAGPSVLQQAAPLVERITGVAQGFMSLRERELAAANGGRPALQPPAGERIVAEAQHAVAQVPGAAAPPPPAPTDNPAPAEPPPHWTAQLRPYVPFALACAREGRDAGLYGYLFIDRLTHDQYDTLARAVLDGRFKAEMYEHLPALRQGGEWMERFLDGVEALVRSNESEEDEEVDTDAAAPAASTEEPGVSAE